MINEKTKRLSSDERVHCARPLFARTAPRTTFGWAIRGGAALYTHVNTVNTWNVMNIVNAVNVVNIENISNISNMNTVKMGVKLSNNC